MATLTIPAVSTKQTCRVYTNNVTTGSLTKTDSLVYTVVGPFSITQHYRPEDGKLAVTEFADANGLYSKISNLLATLQAAGGGPDGTGDNAVHLVFDNSGSLSDPAPIDAGYMLALGFNQKLFRTSSASLADITWTQGSSPVIGVPDPVVGLRTVVTVDINGTKFPYAAYVTEYDADNKKISIATPNYNSSIANAIDDVTNSGIELYSGFEADETFISPTGKVVDLAPSGGVATTVTYNTIAIGDLNAE